ncbi:MAG: DUF2163 domain-containing protein [bacterium]|nr:DUF2163 domain-containing protein [bacterium]
MPELSSELQEHLDSGATTLSWCWRLTRSDGVVFGFTDHDRDLEFDGTVFESEAGLIPSELRDGSDLSVDAQDAEGVLTSDKINETDIFDGLWDNAEVEVYRVNWQDVSQRFLRRRGNVGQIRRGRVSFIAEVRSLAHALNQPVGRTYMPTCDVELGSAKCGINLSDPAFRGDGVVSGLRAGRTYLASGLGAFANAFFDHGVIEWITGANAGRRSQVSRHVVEDGVAQLTILDEPVRSIEAGDAFRVTAGCDKRLSTCRDRFGNVNNFRGFPHIPGPSTVLRYPVQGKGNDGRML